MQHTGVPRAWLSWENMSAMHQQPTGAAFDVVLLLHVACVIVGLATTAATAATARRLRRLLHGGAPVPEALRRYFQPGVNWAGRVVYGIPVFGVALVAMSRGAYALGDGWVLAGVVLFAALAVVGESVLWPAERRVQAGVQRTADESDVAVHQSDADALSGDAVLLERAALAAVVLLVAGTVIMVAQP
jgi:hypothetical protein